jgi:hypothetical protein
MNPQQKNVGITITINYLNEDTENRIGKDLKSIFLIHVKFQSNVRVGILCCFFNIAS